jgi:hypothetical protein
MTLSVRTLVWACVSVVILLGGLYALGLGAVTLHPASSAASAPGSVQSAALQALIWTVAREAVLPNAALALLLWLVLVRFVPRIDASGWALAASLPACALLVFPIVGAFTFEAWSPSGVGDVAGTAGLLAASVGAALWLARRIVPGLRPGAFGTGRR